MTTYAYTQITDLLALPPAQQNKVLINTLLRMLDEATFFALIDKDLLRLLDGEIRQNKKKSRR